MARIQGRLLGADTAADMKLSLGDDASERLEGEEEEEEELSVGLLNYEDEEEKLELETR